jgi:hypothetical protein
MADKFLAVVETAYRATIEEQDDPVVWLTHSLRGAGADIHLLLRGAAVNYAVRGQDASGLSFGGRAQTQPPRIEHDLTTLLAKGAVIYYVQDDTAVRGLRREELLDGLSPVPAADLPALFGQFQQVWHW